MTVKLKVRQADKEDVYKDILRVAENYRKDSCGQVIPEGTVCRVSVESTDKYAYGILRGNREDDSEIELDEYLRSKLGVELRETYDFTFTCHWWYKFWWPLKATDPGYRISSQIALLSLLLGILAVVLACK